MDLTQPNIPARCSGVDVNLDLGTAAGGDAAGDSLTDIENLAGSSHDDTLSGDSAGQCSVW